MSPPTEGAKRGPSEGERRALHDLLDETPALTLATLDPDGTPRATPLFFAVDELKLIFLSDPESRHCLNLLAQPRCGIGLYPTVDSWQALRGLQMRGQAHLLAGMDVASALAVYLRRFPFAAELMKATERAAPYRFEPDWIRRIDNRQGFGFHQEWRLDD